MAKLILVGTDVALLEGLAQTLLGLGHDVSFAGTVAEAAGSLSEHLPALAVVSCEALEEGGVAMTLPLTPGGAMIVYGTSHDDQPFLPTKLQRATLAHLVLPWSVTGWWLWCSPSNTARARRVDPRTNGPATIPMPCPPERRPLL